MDILAMPGFPKRDFAKRDSANRDSLKKDYALGQMISFVLQARMALIFMDFLNTF